MDDDYNIDDEFLEDGYEPLYDDKEDLDVLPKREKGEKKERGGVPISLAAFVIAFLVFATAAYLGREQIPGIIESFMNRETAEEIDTTTDGEITLPESQPEEIVFENVNVPQINIESSTKAAFIGYDKNFLYCTKDGVKYFDGNFNTLWNYTYTLTSPAVVNDGPITAVGDTGP